MASPVKRPKPDPAANGGSGLQSFSGFTVKRILNENPERKNIIAEGRFSSDPEAPAIVVLEKTPFSKERVSDLLGADTGLREQFKNDIYGKYEVTLPAVLNQVKANVIYPATEKHIAKYEARDMFLVMETPAIYHSLTLPFLEKETFNIEWVYNILEHRKETEHIVYEDPDPERGFILLPDFKWSGKNIEDLYLLAIVHNRNIKSIRDLTPEHLPMLRDIWSKCTSAITAKHGVPASQIRAYFHYQPSYYHLHVHFTYVGYQAPGINTEKSHMLNAVIGNLEKQADFYARATIPFIVKDGSNMHAHFAQAGYAFTKEEEASAGADKVKLVKGMSRFFRALDKAKHEPCGEHWEATFGESAWRMAVMALCLPRELRRKRLCKMALTSALTCLGKETDHSSEWPQKKAEVREILFSNLPVSKASELYELFLSHVKARIGSGLVTSEEKHYRKLLEFEEMLLQWDEIRKEGEEEDKKSFMGRMIRKMCQVRFPGHEKYELFKDASELTHLLQFIMQISGLVSLKRTGWVRSGIRDPERVAGHMFRMGMMAMVLEEDSSCSKIYGGTSVIISILHDVAECIVGDITPKDDVTPQDKHEREMAAMKSLVERLPGPLARDLYDGLVRYETQAEGDADAALTKDLDKYDMILQALDYEARGKKGAFLEEFYAGTKGVFKGETVKALVEELYAVRKKEIEGTTTGKKKECFTGHQIL